MPLTKNVHDVRKGKHIHLQGHLQNDLVVSRSLAVCIKRTSKKKKKKKHYLRCASNKSLEGYRKIQIVVISRYG